MAASYQHDIAAWMDGTESLSDGEYRAYHVVCELIYLNNGPIVLHESGIAGRCNQHVLAFRRNFAKLIERGKLRVESGKIMNARAATELTRSQKRTLVEPPADPPQTPATPPPSSRGDHASKPLKTKELAKTEVSSLSFLLPLEDSCLSLEVVEEERSSGRGWNFDEFWKLYPHKVGKDAARPAFEKARKSGRVAFPDLMAGLRSYTTKTDDRPWCNPSTWLNQGRWQDQPAENNGGKRGSAAAAAGRLAKQIESGELTFAPRPVRPSLLYAASGNNVLLLPKGGRRES
jgi:hypothetical protein